MRREDPMRRLVEQLLRLVQTATLFVAAIVLAIAGSILLEKHTPDPAVFAAYMGLIAAIIALIATYRDKSKR
jgi:hypothetical protein